MERTTTYPSASKSIEALKINNGLHSRPVLNLAEVAEVLGVNPGTVRRLILRGKMKKLPLRHIRVSAEELDRFLSGES